MQLPLQTYLESLVATLLPLSDGQVASYIPELSKANPHHFGVCLVTTDGYVYAAGDADVLFSIQSMSKPLVFGAALSARGREGMLRKVAVEPTGDAFNSISLHPVSGIPLNPMINAGAIATTGCVAGDTETTQWNSIVSSMEAFAGRALELDHAIYQSESDTGFRNRAIGWMLRNANVLERDPTGVVENYFRQCSLQVNCRDLGLIAATLANNGVNPVTGKSALAPEHVVSVLSVMSTCGMYDYAGSWLYEVGMPAKSGVGGGIFAVLPGRFGIGVFSPPLDANGNSVRGIAACKKLSEDFGLHLFSNPRSPGLVLRREYAGSEAISRRVRSPQAAAQLKERADRIRILSLQGELSLAGAEHIGRHILHQRKEADSLILDMQRVNRLDTSAAQILQDTRRTLEAQGRALVFSNVRGRASVEGPLKRVRQGGGFLSFDDNDTAMEWCENRLLGEEHAQSSIEVLSEFPLFQGLARGDVELVQALLRTESFASGATIVQADVDNDDRIFLIVRGLVSVLVPLPDGTHKRVATLSTGTTFGEMTLLGHNRRSATVYADTEVVCWQFSARAFEALAADHLHLKVMVLQNIAQSLATRLGQANQLIGALAA